MAYEPIYKIELPPPKSGNKIFRLNYRKVNEINGQWGFEILAALKKAGVDRFKITPQTKNEGDGRYFVFYLHSKIPQDDNNFHISVKGILDHFQQGHTCNLLVEDSPYYCRTFYIPVRINTNKRKMFLEIYDEKTFRDKVDNDKDFREAILGFCKKK